MGRKLDKPKAGSEVEYIPKAFGNREDPKPVVVAYKQPTEGEKRSALVRNASKSALELYSDIVERFVSKVSGYEDGDGPIATGEDLAARGEDEILIEVAEEITKASGLTEEEAKK